MGFLGLSRRSKLGELVAGIAGRRPIGLLVFGAWLS